MLHEVQHQNAVFGDNADADDGAEERHNIERYAGKPERQDGPEQSEHGAEDDGERFIEGTKFNEQDGEDKEDGHQKNQQEVAEGLLLLLVETPEVNAAGRQRLV